MWWSWCLNVVRVVHVQPVFLLRLCMLTLLIITSFPGSNDTLHRVGNYWMPELQRLGIAAPIILCGCKSGLDPESSQLQQVQTAAKSSLQPLVHA